MLIDYWIPKDIYGNIKCGILEYMFYFWNKICQEQFYGYRGAIMARTSRDVGQKRKLNSYYDYSLLFLIVFIVGFGLVMIYSTSSYNAIRLFGNSTHFIKKQALSATLGVIAMIFVSKLDYHMLLKKLPIIKICPATALYLLCMGLQILVLLVGEEVNGAKRWIRLPGFTFQPSELAKIAVIVFTAYIVNLAPKKISRFAGFVKVCIFVFPLIVLVMVENLSTAIIMGLCMVGICFVASRKKGYFFVTGFLAIGVVVLAVLKESYRMERIQVWLNVESHPKGYQILQGLYAIASGGLFGKGLGESMQKLGFIPEAHNDMIFSVICEELGLFGAVALVTVFVLMIWRIFMIAINAPDLFGGLIATGVLIHIAAQVIINIAVVSNSIPSTGIPLPFISYGGTSIAILLVEMGIVLSVSNQIKYER